ncbi:putative Actin cortical patch SUR7/pH-response regulator pali [Seiridium cardinale]
MNRISIIIPLILSIAGFVLAMLSLFAGSKPGQLEDFHVIAINMSNFGHDLVPTPTTGGSEPTTTDSSWEGWFTSALATIASEIGDELQDIEGDIADKLSAELGISQWYSLHVMTACEGNFAPNATNPDAWYNTTNCTSQRAGFQFNLTEVLDHEISVGPLDLNAADLPIPDDITDAINYLNGFLLAIFVLFCIGAGFAGLSFLASIAALSTGGMGKSRAGTTRTGPSRLMSLINAILSGLAALALMVGAAITTAVAKKGQEKINDKGSEVGISANAGTKFIIITWVSFATMFVTLLYWVVAGIKGRKTTTTSSRRGGAGRFQWRHEKKVRPSYESSI